MTAFLSSAEFPPLSGGKATESSGLYFEPQKQRMCGVHALNHVVGHPVFSAAALEDAVNHVLGESAAAAAAVGETSNDTRDMHVSPGGDYSEQALATALLLSPHGNWALDQTSIRLNPRGHLRLFDDDVVGALVHKPGHWVAWRVQNGVLWELDSLMSGPRKLAAQADRRMEALLRAHGHVYPVLRTAPQEGGNMESAPLLAARASSANVATTDFREGGVWGGRTADPGNSLVGTPSATAVGVANDTEGDAGGRTSTADEHPGWRCCEAVADGARPLPANIALVAAAVEKRDGAEGSCVKKAAYEAKPPPTGRAPGTPAKGRREDGAASNTDWSAEFEADVTTLLGLYRDGGDVWQWLARLPAFGAVVTAASFEESVARFSATTHLHNLQPLGSKDAAQTELPLFRTTSYRVAVLMEAWARTTGIPTAFYIDSFWALLGSLLHKDIGVALAGFTTRARYWCAGTAEPGSGKSPALDPMRDAMLEAMASAKSFCAGEVHDGFHTQLAGTHAAAVDRLRTTNGYLLLASGEGGPLLCPSWPATSSWNQATHVNLQRFLDAAYGGEVPWETAIDRKAKQRETTMSVGVDGQPEMDRRTNVTIIVLQQLAVFAGWWAASEAKCNIGLGARFLFSFGNSREPGPRDTQFFGRDVGLPMCKRLFTRALQRVGPKCPLDAKGLSVWGCSESAAAQIHQCRVRCHDVAKSNAVGATFSAGLNKAPYWLGCCSLLSEIGNQLWVSSALDEEAPSLTPALSDESIKAALEFFSVRYLLGVAAVDVDIAQSAWSQRRKVSSLDTDMTTHAVVLLKQCPGSRIDIPAAARCGAVFRGILSHSRAVRGRALAVLTAAWQHMRNLGLGEMAGSLGDGTDPCFVKMHYSMLGESARQFLRKHGVSLLSFGSEVLPVATQARIGPEADECDTAVDSAGERHPVLHGRDEGVRPRDVDIPSVLEDDTREHLFCGVHQSPEGRGLGEELQPPEVVPAERRPVFHGPPPLPVATAHAFFAAIRWVLGASGEGHGHIGIRADADTERHRVAYARCDTKECLGCTWRARCSYGVEARGGAALCVQAWGAHGVLAPPCGKSLWTLRERRIIEESCSESTDVCAGAIREALKKHGLRVRCDARKLSQFVSRRNRTRHATQPRPAPTIPIEELLRECRRWRLQPGVDWDATPVDALKVFGDMVVTTTRVCICWSTRGMLSTIKSGKGCALSLACDGKQKVVSNEYAILTLSVLHRSSSVRRTRGAAGRTRVQTRADTTTASPLAQALVNTEASENVAHFYRAVADECKRVYGVDLGAEVLQLQKDHAKGLEKPRVDVFPRSRPLNDYAHLCRVCHSSLQSLSTEEAVRSKVEHVLRLTRFVPTVALFHAIWERYFQELGSSGHESIAAYLKTQYIRKVPANSMKKPGWLRDAPPGAEVWFGPYWSGILGTLPGTASGSQSIEAFHRFWQGQVSKRTRSGSTSVLSVMQDLYRDSWSEHFDWDGPPKDVRCWTDRADPCVLNGAMLQREGRSTAVEFWQQREIGNHVLHVTRCQRHGVEKETTWCVMHTGTMEGVAPAGRRVQEATARVLMRLVQADLTEAVRLCTEAKVFNAEGGVDVDVMRALFDDLCVVMLGDFPSEYWPTRRRHSTDALHLPLCTCAPFGLRANCEHVEFLKGLLGVSMLDGVPLHKRKGRPRASGDAADASQRAAKRARDNA